MDPLDSERPVSGLTAAAALMLALSREPEDLAPPAIDAPHPLLPVPQSAPIEEVVARMDDSAVDSLPVLDEEGRIAGDVTRRDILAALLARHAEVVRERHALILAVERQRVALESASGRLTAVNERLAELEKGLLRTGDETAYLRGAIAFLRSLLGARAGVIALRTGEGRWTGLTHSGLEPSEVQRVESLPSERGPLGVIASTPRALRLEDLERHPDAAGVADFHPGARTLLAVPFLIGERVTGGLYLCDRESGGPFREEHAGLAAGFARGLALAHALWRAGSPAARGTPAA